MNNQKCSETVEMMLVYR